MRILIKGNLSLADTDTNTDTSLKILAATDTATCLKILADIDTDTHTGLTNTGNFCRYCRF